MEFYYKDQRLSLPYWGRFAMRFFVYAGGAFCLAAGLVLYVSDILALRIASVIIFIAVLYFLVQWGKPKRPLTNASKEHPNIADYVSPAAYRTIEIALDRAALEQSNFILNLLAELLKNSKESLEFKAKLESRRKRVGHQQTKAQTLEMIAKLMQSAFTEAQTAGAKMITPSHLLRALLKSGLPEITDMFQIFGRTPADVLY